MNFFKPYWKLYQSLTGLQKFAVAFLIFNGIYYWPLSIQAGFGPQHILLMLAMIVVGCCICKGRSKAMLWGSVYFLWQLFIVFIHGDAIRWSTIFFSFGLVFTYVGFYNLVYLKKVFTLDLFIELLKFMMLLAFAVCILQQLAVLAGMQSLPAINLLRTYTEKGALACNSLFHEMSTFARSMLVCYYAYVKCCELKRGKGRFTPKELLQDEHRWITIRFLWMMLTMASGTAMVGLLAFSLYFITKKNALILIPVFCIGYGLLDHVENTQLQRSLRVIEATRTFDRDQIVASDGSAATRIAPLVNSFHADFTKKETWFGHGLDYSINNNLVIYMNGTLFDDYGFLLFLLGYVFNFTCAYKLNSLAALFMILGIGGGLGGNIPYGWELAMIMTVVRYFMEQETTKSHTTPQALHV